MAIEDAAALGILFNPKYFNGDVADTLSIYDAVRLPRATRVQSAAAKAAYNINERIGKPSRTDPSLCIKIADDSPGFSSNTNIGTYKVEDEKKKLTIEEMNACVLSNAGLYRSNTNTPVVTTCTRTLKRSLHSGGEIPSQRSGQRGFHSACNWPVELLLVLRHERAVRLRINQNFMNCTTLLNICYRGISVGV